jgi:hypothetical protein
MNSRNCRAPRIGSGREAEHRLAHIRKLGRKCSVPPASQIYFSYQEARSRDVRAAPEAVAFGSAGKFK